MYTETTFKKLKNGRAVIEIRGATESDCGWAISEFYAPRVGDMVAARTREHDLAPHEMTVTLEQGLQVQGM